VRYEQEPVNLVVIGHGPEGDERDGSSGHAEVQAGAAVRIAKERCGAAPAFTPPAAVVWRLPLA
jgi:hypothetical protein